MHVFRRMTAGAWARPDAQRRQSVSSRSRRAVGSRLFARRRRVGETDEIEQQRQLGCRTGIDLRKQRAIFSRLCPAARRRRFSKKA